MDQANLFLIGSVLGCIIGACFAANYYNDSTSKAEKILEAYEKYYICTETLLDSLDGEHNLDLMNTDLATDYGIEYLHAKSIVDSLRTSND